VSCADCGSVSGALCGNGLCEAGDGEDCLSCPEDCAGKQNGQNRFCCGDGDGDGAILNCGFDADGFTVLDDRCITGGYFCRVAPRVPACCGDSLCEGQEQITGPDYCEADCAGSAPCEPTGNRERANQGECDDGIDNDCDGLIDGEDPDCCVATEDPEVTCNDGIDNDCDGLIDGEDPDCCVATEDPEVTCNDGIDNDCDGLTDTDDPDCQSGGVCNNDGVCEPGEDCNNCGGDCDSRTNGRPSDRYCCGNGIVEGPEGDGRCDGNP
jgi:hypothetical protein